MFPLALLLAACDAKDSSKSLRLQQINLVSSVQDYAPVTDEKMTDAWGLEFGHKGRVWLSNSSGFSTVYDGAGKVVSTKDPEGAAVPLVVEVPIPEGETEEAPLTGMVFSDTDAFSGDSFIFVTEQGTIAGWHKRADGFEPLTATMRIDNFADGAVYKGATAAQTSAGWLLYAANFAQGRIDVFNDKYDSVSLPGNFIDPDLPIGFAPFNIKEIGGQLYVTYAKQSIDKQNDVQGTGNGWISIFQTDGTFVKRFAANGMLNSPWGLALAPENFGALSGLLLVGNFGDGHINAFHPETGKQIGIVRDEAGASLQIDGLWSLTFGTDNGAGARNELFFAAGPSAEDQGLFGKLTPVE